ncbi:MAG: hypothetical protein ABIH49_01205 [archaeon]
MNKKILIYAALGILILVLLVFTFFPNMTYAIKDFNRQGSLGSNDDICSPPAGTSMEEWRTHMGHHPDIYKECLG